MVMVIINHFLIGTSSTISVYFAYILLKSSWSSEVNLLKVVYYCFNNLKVSVPWCFIATPECFIFIYSFKVSYLVSLYKSISSYNPNLFKTLLDNSCAFTPSKLNCSITNNYLVTKKYTWSKLN